MKAGLISLGARRTRGAGRLVPVESCKEIPFRVERVYWVVEAHPTELRGGHAHRHGSELLVCLQGQCQVALEWADGTGEYLLDRPDLGLLVPALHWLDYRLSAGAVLLALADRAFDPADTVRDHARFLDLAFRGR